MADLSSVLMSGPELLSPANFASAANAGAVALNGDGDGGSAEIAQQFESNSFSKVFRAQLEGEAQATAGAVPSGKAVESAELTEEAARLVETLSQLKRQLSPEQAESLDSWLAETSPDKILATLTEEPAFSGIMAGDRELMAKSLTQLKELASGEGKLNQVLTADDPQAAMIDLMTAEKSKVTAVESAQQPEALLEQVNYLKKWRQQGDGNAVDGQSNTVFAGDKPIDGDGGVREGEASTVNAAAEQHGVAGNTRQSLEQAAVKQPADISEQDAEVTDTDEVALSVTGSGKPTAGQAGDGGGVQAKTTRDSAASQGSVTIGAPAAKVSQEASEVSEEPVSEDTPDSELTSASVAQTSEKSKTARPVAAAVGQGQPAMKEAALRVGEQSLTGGAQAADDIKQATEVGAQVAQSGVAAQQIKESLGGSAKSESRSVSAEIEAADGSELSDEEWQATAGTEAVRRQGVKTPVMTDSVLARQLAQAGAENTQANDARAEQASRQQEDRFVTELNALRSMTAQRESQAVGEQPVRLSLQPGSFAPQMKEKIALMVAANQQEATIQLDPEELGGMNIRISMQADQMNVSFQVQNGQAKELLEDAMGKLKEMLAEQGIALGDSQVSQEQSSSQDGGGEHPAGSPVMADEEEGHQLTLMLHRQERDGIDYYA